MRLIDADKLVKDIDNRLNNAPTIESELVRYGRMRELTCKNCGGRINPITMQCEYCDSQYEMQLDRVLFVNGRRA